MHETGGLGSDHIAVFSFSHDLLCAASIRIYTIGVGDSWAKGNTSTNSLRMITEASGGLAIAAGDAEQMREGFRTINALEKSTVEKETTVNHRDIYFYFLIAAVFAAILFLASAALIREDA